MSIEAGRVAAGSDGRPLVFALEESRVLATQIAHSMGVELSPMETRAFGGGEHKSRPLVNVRNRTTVVIQSLCGDEALSANDKLVRLLFFAGALHDASAGRIIVVTPYLTYARKDRQTKRRDPVTTRSMAQLIEAMGVDHVVVVDVHNVAAFQNAFRIRTDHVEAAIPLVHRVLELVSGPIAVVSPDLGGVKRARRFAQILQDRVDDPVRWAVMEKFRSEGVVSGRVEVLGDVAGCSAVVVDDLIDGGGTMLRAAAASRDAGACRVVACATHGVFGPGAERILSDDRLDAVVITDTIDQRSFRERSAPLGRPDGGRLSVVGLGPWLARAVDAVVTGRSLADQLEIEDGAEGSQPHEESIGAW